MFWKKRFERNEEGIKQLSAKSEVSRARTEILGKRSKSRDAVISERLSVFMDKQLEYNNGNNELTTSMSDIINSLSKKIDALVETHHNQAMYNGVLNADKKSDK